ncbi:efflux transporter outer membrane subunit [Massilia endophytica]|uniref:efflux transporter outer membrane subunit n=1 Tax=Massilia endophytica TaxID=2899220 RepID=UPI001E364B84|nr:efflux transporter outer membrane subunit [Massilia endophytica]UGQ47160.1 efflux transporter outer membrane subunit [Massilia endophytica]
MKSLPLSLLCAALTACAAAGPDFEAPRASAPSQWSQWHGGAAELADTGLPGGPAFARFNDPVLAALLAQASANPDLQTALLRFAQSRVQSRLASSQLGPQLGARGGAMRQRQSESGAATRMADALAPGSRDAIISVLSDPFTVYQAGFDASWELDLWGRTRRVIEAADAESSAASAQLRQMQLTIAVEVARRYFQLRAAQEQQDIARADIETAEQLLELASLRQRRGLASGTDTLRLDAQLAQQRAALPALLEQEAAALNGLTLLGTQPPGALNALPGERSLPPAPDLSAGLPGELLRRRPDVQAAEDRLHAATASIGVAKADLYPRITLGLSAGLESVAAGSFGDWGSRQWSVGPSISLPIFDGGRRRATVLLRELQQQEAAVQFQKTVLAAWHEMDEALSAYAAERQRLAQWRQREESALSVLALAEVRHKRGLSDAQPVLEARRGALQAERERVGSEAALALRLLAICKAAAVTPAADVSDLKH